MYDQLNFDFGAYIDFERRTFQSFWVHPRMTLWGRRLGLGRLGGVGEHWWTWWTGRMDPNSTLHQSSSPPSDNSARNQRFGKKNSWSLRIFGDCTYILFVSLPNFHISPCHRWHLLKKISFFPAESDPGIARPLHLFPLPVLNASKLTMIWLLVLFCWWLKENKAVPTLPMFQLVQSMQRGKGLGRNKGRIKAVRKTFEKN